MEKHELKTEQNSKKRQRNFQLMQHTGTKNILASVVILFLFIASWNSY